MSGGFLLLVDEILSSYILIIDQEMEADMSDTYENARNGKYDVKLPYPSRPSEPAVLRRKVKELSAEEIASIPTVKAEYEAAQVAFREAQTAYKLEERRLHEEFQADLEAEHGMTGHPKAGLLFTKAWDHGHSSGFTEVAIAYNDLVDLVK